MIKRCAPGLLLGNTINAMKALVYHGTRNVSVDEVPDPKIIDSKDANGYWNKIVTNISVNKSG